MHMTVRWLILFETTQQQVRLAKVHSHDLMAVETTHKNLMSDMKRNSNCGSDSSYFRADWSAVAIFHNLLLLDILKLVGD